MKHLNKVKSSPPNLANNKIQRELLRATGGRIERNAERKV